MKGTQKKDNKIAVKTNLFSIKSNTDVFACMVMTLGSGVVRKQYASTLPDYVQLSLEVLASTATTGMFMRFLVSAPDDKIAVLDSWAYYAFKVSLTRVAINYLRDDSRNLAMLAAVYLATNFVIELSGRVLTGYTYNWDRLEKKYGNEGILANNGNNCERAYQSLLSALTTTSGILAGELLASHYGFSRSDNILSYLAVQYVANSATCKFVTKFRETCLSSEEVSTVDHGIAQQL